MLGGLPQIIHGVIKASGVFGRKRFLVSFVASIYVSGPTMAARIVAEIQAEGLLEPTVLATLSLVQLKLAAELAGKEESEEVIEEAMEILEARWAAAEMIGKAGIYAAATEWRLSKYEHNTSKTGRRYRHYMSRRPPLAAIRLRRYKQTLGQAVQVPVLWQGYGALPRTLNGISLRKRPWL